MLTSLPEEAVDVVYDGKLGLESYWIVHIEPSGIVNIWKNPAGSSTCQIIDNAELALSYSIRGMGIRTFMDTLITSIGIEGLVARGVPDPVGGVETLSEIAYRVVPVSG